MAAMKWIFSALVVLVACWLGYPQPDLNMERDILPLARNYASSSGQTETPLEGVRVVITGATSGIGLGLVQQFASMGATVIALGRSPKKLKALKEEIGGSLTTVEVQLADLESVQKAAEEISSQFESIDILINNAGMHYQGQSMEEEAPSTPQDIDLSFGVNYVSHFLLTEKVLPLLRNSTHHPTVVQVSSSFHWAVDGSELIPIHDIETPISAIPGGFQGIFASQRAYANSKLAQILHARALQRRYNDIRVKSICPCWVGTSIGGESTITGFFLGLTGFPQDGFGIKSALTAALDVSVAADYYTNSPATELADLVLPKVFFEPWVYRWHVRDVFFFNFAGLLLTLQKFGSTVMARSSSPESYNEALQEGLYQWSYKSVQAYL